MIVVIILQNSIARFMRRLMLTFSRLPIDLVTTLMGTYRTNKDCWTQRVRRSEERQLARRA